MSRRRWHRATGLALLLPLLAWALTGLVFLIKPGYEDAYAILQIPRHSVNHWSDVSPSADWLEWRRFHSAIGEHLLVQTDDGWQQVQPGTQQPRPLPDDAMLQRLFHSAIALSPDRYGQVVSISGNTAMTDTGVKLSLDWPQMTLRQQGRDTRLIDALYRVHYLQWTGVDALDKLLGTLGPLLLLILAALGLSMALRKEPS